MTPNQQREEISKAYIAAVAAACGFKLGTWSQDDDCLDVTIGAAGILGRGTLAGPKLDVQLKCSSEPSHDKGDSIHWQLKRAHHDSLRAQACVPRIIVAVILPEHVHEWVEHSPQSLILRRCGYWKSLRGEPEISTDKDSATIQIPKTDVFSPDTLRGLMERISAGDEL